MAQTYKLFINAGMRNKKITIDVPKGASVEELMKKISDWNGIPADSQRVIFTSKQLQTVKDGKKQYISDYKIQDRSELFVVLTLPGGNDPDPEEPRQKVLPEDVELTDEPDMITWDDDPDNKRAKMPCGHGIGPEALTVYCRSLLSVGKYQFYCPYKDRDNTNYCGKNWEYYTIRKIAALTENEKTEFETKISQNYMRKAAGIQECPECTSFCIRKDSKDRRVVCLSCSKDGVKYEFCWYCLGVWNSLSTTKCGNDACSGEDPRLKILREATKKEIVGLKGCPSIRACPQCGMLISHLKDCKQMKCICDQKFCFICLKKAVNNSYQCGFYNYHCTIAPIQQVMPGDTGRDDPVDKSQNSCVLL